MFTPSLVTVRRVVCAIALVAACTPSAFALDTICDPARRDAAGRDCRDILIRHIRQENVRLDVAFWFMEDSWIASEIIARRTAGVPVRILMDTEANVSTPRNATRLAEFTAAGIPMRERIASGILHWKMMLFEGQGIVQFSGANYSSDAWTVSGPDYTNYTDEAIYFSSKPSIVDSFKTKYDDLWVNTTQYRDYANVSGPLTRAYGTFPIDPDLNFVPTEPHAARALPVYAAETTGIDAIMYRITDSRYSDAMIAAENRGVPVRLLTEPQQYRDVTRQYHSWNVDRMYMAGVEIRDRAHPGLNHQKSVIVRGQATAIFGSSNWSPSSSDSQEEHNLFSTDPDVYQWFVDQFERKWTNATGLIESAPFAPLPPDKPAAPSPAPLASGVPLTGLTFSWNGGYWAHKYDLYLGTSPGGLSLVAADLPRATSGLDTRTFPLKTSLLPGTTYYWKVTARTMANMTAESPIWSFTTLGSPAPPASPVVTLVRGPYLQQVSSSSAIVVWATREAGAAQVKYSLPGGSVTTVTATSTLFPVSRTGLAADYYQHVATITGLSPATTYQYDLLVDGVDLNPQVDTVTTAPVAGSSTVSFVAIGDSGTGSAAQQRVATRLASESFDFALHAGDIAYGNSGGTGAATHQTMDDWFFAMYGGWLRSRVMFPSIGNHDSRAANLDGRPYLDMFVLPTAGGNGAYPDHAERYYSFDYGPVHVVVLDTELAFQAPNLARRDAQIAWLHADLSSTVQPWTVVVFHRSPYSAGGEHGSDLEVRQAFGPVFDAFDVDLVISAHEHVYERTMPIRGGQVVSSNGTIYIVTGGGGGPLYPSGTDVWTAQSGSVFHYLKGTASDCVLKVDAITDQGALFDTVSLQRCQPGPDTQAPSVSVVSPAAGASVNGAVSVQTAVSDNVGVTAVTLVVDGVDVTTGTTAPFVFTWDTTAGGNGGHTIVARAVDAAGNQATSAPVNVTVANAVLGAGDILLHTADATTLVGNWVMQTDATAASGKTVRNPDTGMAKRTTAHAAPADYVEMTFTAQVNVPYRLWMRGKADGNVYSNDSVFVQFSGADKYAIGTTAAAEYNLEDCSGCRVAGWGWQDNGWGVGVLGPTITFTSAGPHTIRMQPREDGLSIDQILLSPSNFLSTAPGPLRNDTTIYPRSAGGTTNPPPPDTQAPVVTIDAPAAGTTVSGVVPVAITATDNVGVARVTLVVDGLTLQSDTVAPYSINWDTLPVANGSHTVSAIAVDAAGNSTQSASLQVTVNNTTTPPALPSPWTSQDVGAVGPSGSATASAGVFTLKGGGADIWGTADAFHYAWQPISGDVDLVARVTSIQNVHAWVKAGVMIRGGLTPDAAHGLMLVSPGKGLAFQRRTTAGAISSSTSGGSGMAPAWVKLSRRGAVITAYRSTDGATWTLVGSDTFALPSDAFVGLVVSSHDTTKVATATFDQVTVTPITSNPSNVAPTVAVSSPAPGATFTAPASITIDATASDSDGSVTRVEFFQGSTLIGTDTTAPYQAVWTGAPAGNFSITARAIDDGGAVSTSTAVNVVVSAPVPTLPAPWTSTDIGAVGAAGSASESGGVYTVKGAGADIWGTADALQYVWQPIVGDVDVITRVASIENVHAWVKAGVMIRESNSAGSAQALMLVSPGKGLAFQRRITTGGISTSTGGGSGVAPQWVKLERRGNTITAFRSADGVTWTLVGSDTFAMGSSVHVGLAVSSHTTTRAATATFDNVTVIAR